MNPALIRVEDQFRARKAAKYTFFDLDQALVVQLLDEIGIISTYR